MVEILERGKLRKAKVFPQQRHRPDRGTYRRLWFRGRSRYIEVGKAYLPPPRAFHALLLLVTAVGMIATACSGEMTLAADREAENLAAFARVYGYVRFFYPGDEAAAVDL